jgi:hypothetical protein
MTRIKIYDEETVVYGKRVPKSRLEEVSNLVESYLLKFKVPEKHEDLPHQKKIKKASIHRMALSGECNGHRMFVYPCGCYRDKLFIRNENCKIPDESHKP